MVIPLRTGTRGRNPEVAGELHAQLRARKKLENELRDKNFLF